MKILLRSEVPVQRVPTYSTKNRPRREFNIRVDCTCGQIACTNKWKGRSHVINGVECLRLNCTEPDRHSVYLAAIGRCDVLQLAANLATGTLDHQEEATSALPSNVTATAHTQAPEVSTPTAAVTTELFSRTLIGPGSTVRVNQKWMSTQQQATLRNMLSESSVFPSCSAIKEMWRIQGCTMDDTVRNSIRLKNVRQRSLLRNPDLSEVQRSSNVEELLTALRARIEQPSAATPHKLCLLPDMEFNAETGDVFIPFTCWGFLRAASKCMDEHLALVVDGKCSVLQRGWIIMTVGWLTSGNRPRLTTTTRFAASHEVGVRTQSREYTNSLVPFMLAIVASESTASMKLLFSCLRKYWPTTETLQRPIADRVSQLHKDYSPSFENGRAYIFSSARSCGDFAHFMRNLHHKLHAAGYNSEAVRKVRSMAYATRFLPTAELFSIMWEHTLEWLSRQNQHQLISYMTQHYVRRRTAAELIACGVWVDPTLQGPLLWGDFQVGCLTILPGTATGS